jgi:hypothetical protein
MAKKKTTISSDSCGPSEADPLHNEVVSYLERRRSEAYDAENDLEVGYLDHCLLALEICQQLGVFKA